MTNNIFDSLFTGNDNIYGGEAATLHNIFDSLFNGNENIYGGEAATLHNYDGTLETVVIHDSNFGRNGYGGILHSDGSHEFVETILITIGMHAADDCDSCEHIRETNA